LAGVYRYVDRSLHGTVVTHHGVGIAIIDDLECAGIVLRHAAKHRITLLYCALPFIPNLLCTLLIVTKLLWYRHDVQTRQAREVDGGEYGFLASCLAESGAAYTTAGIINFVFALKGHNGQTISSAIFGASAVSHLHRFILF
jgi:hypothetical protein